MNQSPFYLALKDIAEQKEDIKVHLASGGAKTQEDYWRMVGAFRAVERVEGILKDIEQRYIED